jgi:hypothetical protein
MPNKEDKNIKLPCRRCGLATNHVIKHVETVANDAERAFLDDRYEVVKCLGCDCVTIRHLFSELDYIDDEIKTNAVFYPPLTFRKWPEWAKSLDQTLQDLLYQVYVAVHNKLNRLAAMGIRAILEYLMVSQQTDKGTFHENLEAFEKSGAISTAQKETLRIILDAGSATIHRGYNPQEIDVISILDITELVLKDIFVNRPAMQSLKQRIPPRPQKNK